MEKDEVKVLPSVGVVAPYVMGPAIRRFSVPLLWQKQLIISAGAFISPFPFHHLVAAAKGAHNTPLSELFNVVGNYAVLSRQVGDKEFDQLSDLRGRVLSVAFVGPGTPKAYQDIDPFLQSCLPFAMEMLRDTQAMFVAANAFAWRVYDTALEFGGKPEAPLDDSSPVLNYLLERASKVGGPPGLLGECLLQRCASIGQVSACVTDSKELISILAEFGRSMTSNVDGIEPQANQLGFGIFETLLSPYMPSLEPPHTRRIASLLNDRSDELEMTKTKCVTEARKLIGDFPQGNITTAAVDASLATMNEEIAAILDVDRNAVRNLFRRVTQDDKMWIAISGLLASLTGALPSIVPAAAAVTAISLLGANALKESRERKDALKKSPWKFVYHLRHEH